MVPFESPSRVERRAAKIWRRAANPRVNCFRHSVRLCSTLVRGGGALWTSRRSPRLRGMRGHKGTRTRGDGTRGPRTSSAARSRSTGLVADVEDMNGSSLRIQGLVGHLVSAETLGGSFSMMTLIFILALGVPFLYGGEADEVIRFMEQMPAEQELHDVDELIDEDASSWLQQVEEE